MSDLDPSALAAAYASAPIGKRDKNLIATAIRAYLDARPIPDDAEHVLSLAHSALNLAARRAHGATIPSDHELYSTFLKIRADIEDVLSANRRPA